MEAVILFTKAQKHNRLAKSIYGGGSKMPASVNRFTEAVVLKQPPQKVIYF
jgi:hypothetical protein